MRERTVFADERDMRPYLITRQDLKETLEYISGYSLYAYEDEIRQGYISVAGRTQSWCHRQGEF